MYRDDTIDAFLTELDHQQISHLAALLNIVATRLKANKAPENVENVIALIRGELGGDEGQEEQLPAWRYHCMEEAKSRKDTGGLINACTPDVGTLRV